MTRFNAHELYGPTNLASVHKSIEPIRRRLDAIEERLDALEQALAVSGPIKETNNDG